MAKNSTQTFYGTNRSRRNQTHKTRRQIVKEFVDEWVGKSKNGIIKEDANRQPFIDDLLRRVCGIEQPTQYIQYEKDVQVKADGLKPSATEREIVQHLFAMYSQLTSKENNLS